MSRKNEISVVKTDNRGRICDPVTGRPLRDRQNRTGAGQPFHGKPGKPNRKATARLERRIQTFEEMVARNAKNMGNKHDIHRPGSLTK